MNSHLPAPPDAALRPDAENFELVRKWSDDLARTAAALPWTDQQSRTALIALARTPADFNAAIPQPVLARRAECLVLALDRLVAALPEARRSQPLNAALTKLFNDAQSLPDFKPADFAAHLDEFQKLIPV